MANDPDVQRRIIARRRGNRLGFWFFKASLRLFGLKGTYGLLYFVCAWYLLFDRPAVRVALAYLRRRFRGASPGRLRWLAYQLFISQGRCLIDRHALISGHVAFEFDKAGFENLHAALSVPRPGCVLLLCHAGNWQLAMSQLPLLDRAICSLMRPEDNPAVAGSLRVNQAGKSFRVVSPEQFLGGVVELLNAVQAGEIVMMMGDRGYGYSTVDVPFLGDPAALPCGAFTLAAAAGCPIVALLTAKTGTTRYRIEVPAVFRPRYVPGRPRKEQLNTWVHEYAAVLESYCARHPLQFFLFHDVWSESSARRQ